MKRIGWTILFWGLVLAPAVCRLAAAEAGPHAPDQSSPAANAAPVRRASPSARPSTRRSEAAQAVAAGRRPGLERRHAGRPTAAGQPAVRATAPRPVTRRTAASQRSSSPGPSTYALPPADVRRGTAQHGIPTRGSLRPIFTALSALAVVVGLFLMVAWLVKRKLPAAHRPLPVEVVELLGRTPLPDRQSIHLVRVGKKLLLIAASSAGVGTLTEITDPVEVDRLAGLCQQTHANSTTAAFRQVMQQFSRERSTPSFVDVGGVPAAPSALGRRPVRESFDG